MRCSLVLLALCLAMLFMVVLNDVAAILPGVLEEPTVCPVMGPNCDCKCQEGDCCAPCLCATKKMPD